MSLGSISGNLLSPNLLRNGENLAFETTLIYLDVVNSRVGFNTSTPVRELTTTWLTTDYLISDNFTVGNVAFSPNTIQDFVNQLYITPNQSSNPQIILPSIGVAGFSINSTTILGAINNNIIFQTDALGNVQFNTPNILVNGDLHTTGDITYDGNTQFGNQTNDTITFVAEVTSDILPNTSIAISGYELLLENSTDLLQEDNVGFFGIEALSSYSLGSATSNLRWKDIYANIINIGGLTQISSNRIIPLTTNSDLVLTAGTGMVTASSNVVIDNNLNASTLVLNTSRINGLLTVGNILRTGTTNLTGDINQTGNTIITGSMYLSNLITSQTGLIQTGDYSISNNILSTINLNESISLNPTKNVSFFNTLQFNNNQIINTITGSHTDLEKSIVFNPSGSGNVVINTTKPLRIPYNNDSTFVLSHTGQIRENSTTNFYEGWAPSGTISFYQLYSSNRHSYIIPELTPYSGGNVLRFAVNNVVTTTIDTTKIYNTTSTFGNVRFNQNTISNSNPLTDITINPLGSDSTYVNSIQFNQNSILNPTNGALQFSTSGTGYVKFSGTAGIVLPTGNTSQQPLSPEVGTLRYNTDNQIDEVWNGTAWVSNSVTPTVADVTDIMDIWTIILG